MRSTFLRLFALVAATVLSACDSATLTDPTPVRPSFSGVLSDHGKHYTLVEHDMPVAQSSASAWIGQDGGMVYVHGGIKEGRPTMHGVYVPEGAVNKSTLFTVTVLSGKVLGVRLEAQEQSKNGRWIEVGSRGFRKPVLLFMTYAWATNVSDASKLTILYDPEDGRHHQETSARVLLDVDRYVIAELKHFSKYVLAME